MKKNIVLLLFIILLFVVFSAKASFVEGLEDVPLPKNVTQIENGSLSFDNEEIRFFESYLAVEKQNFEHVVKFYNDTLPQMGWQKKGSAKQKISFERDGESLEITKESEKPLILRLVVKSKQQ